MKQKQATLNSPLELFTRNMFTEVIQKLSAFLSEGDFTLSEIAALHVVDKSSGVSVNSVAQSLNLSKSATSRLISGLEGKGLLEKGSSEKDSRMSVVICSKKGKQFLNEMSLQRTAAAEEVIKELSPQISKQLLATISNIKRSES